MNHLPLRLVLLFAFLLLGMLATGCASTGAAGDESSLPWNEPASWERTGFGIPM